MNDEQDKKDRSAAAPIIRAALDSDLDAVFELLRVFMDQRQLLHRTRMEVAKLLQTGFVAECDSQLVGFSSIEIYSKKLAEIQCLAVRVAFQGRGIGRVLVEHCVDLAKSRGVMEVLVISSSESFLRDLGFDYSLPDQKRALFLQLRSREEVFREMEEAD